MFYFVSIVHVLTCIFVVLFILFQDPKGGVLGSLGGGGKSFFGSEGASSFLVKITKWLAILFACTSFYLSYTGSQKGTSLMATPEKAEEQTAPKTTEKKAVKIPENSEKTK